MNVRYAGINVHAETAVHNVELIKFGPGRNKQAKSYSPHPSTLKMASKMMDTFMGNLQKP